MSETSKDIVIRPYEERDKEVCVNLHRQEFEKVDLGTYDPDFHFDAEEGRIIENCVNMNGNFKFFSRIGSKEIDFILINKKKEIIPIEAKYRDKINAKEIKGTLAFMESNSLKEGIIITKSLDKKEQINRKNIKFIPLWKWLLERSGSILRTQ